jgi:hypothetical protein
MPINNKLPLQRFALLLTRPCCRLFSCRECFLREHGRTLVLITPAGLEEAFKQLSEPAQAPTLPPPPEGPPDVEQLRQALAVFEAYGLEFAVPPQQP